MSRYFKTRDPWVVAYPDFKERTKAFEQVQFHREAISQVKKALGAKCTFLSHVITNGKLSFIAYLNVNNKVKKISISEDVPSAFDLVADDYKKLKLALDEQSRS